MGIACRVRDDACLEHDSTSDKLDLQTHPVEKPARQDPALPLPQVKTIYKFNLQTLHTPRAHPASAPCARRALRMQAGSIHACTRRAQQENTAPGQWCPSPASCAVMLSVVSKLPGRTTRSDMGLPMCSPRALTRLLVVASALLPANPACEGWEYGCWYQCERERQREWMLTQVCA